MAYRGDLAPFRDAINSAIARSPDEAQKIATQWLTLATRERNVEEARRALAALPRDGCREETFLFPRGWCEDRIALLAGDAAAAQRLFSEARQAMEKTAKDQSNYLEGIGIIALLDAALGRKGASDCRRSTRRLHGASGKDSLVGAKMIIYLAQIYAVTGENDLALPELEKSARPPAG